MWLLAWEKLHPVILGPLMIILGAVMLSSAPIYSKDQLEAGISLLVGLGLFVDGVRKVRTDTKDMNWDRLRVETERRNAEASAPPDYAKYTETQLNQILGRIDKERFPERVAEIEARLHAIASERGTSKSVLAP